MAGALATFFVAISDNREKLAKIVAAK